MPPKASRWNPFRRHKGAKDSEDPLEKKNSDPQGAAVPSAGLAPSSNDTTSLSMAVGDAPQPAQTSHIFTGTPLQSHEEVPSSIGPTSVPRRNTAVLVVLAAPTPLDSAASPIVERLWDQAYEDLKTDESLLVIAYEKLLSRNLDRNATDSVASESQDNAIEQTNPAIRRAQMCQLVQAGLKETESAAKGLQLIGNAVRVVLSAKEFVDSAIQAVPQAALAWAGVCFALQILINSTDESKANRDGIIYVMKRMEWYLKLSRLLFKENIRQVDGRSFMGLQRELEKRLVDLYKKLLSYQIKSVCSYHRKRGVAIFRDIVKLDDWNGSLETVKDAETAFENDSKQYNIMQINDNLDQLVNAATNEERKLGDIHSTLQQQVAREDSREHKQCLTALCLTDPRNDMTRIEKTKGGLLQDSYVWILSHPDFIDWREGDKTRLLWIRGDPGKGKRMLLIGVVKELQKSIDDSELVSYFFCQRTDADLKKATAVLRGLIYQLLEHQSFLISHLQEQFDTREKLLTDASAFFALSKIFNKMLHDIRLTKVYLVVDALDECDEDLEPLLDLIGNASTPRVKWLVSSRYQRNIAEGLKIEGSKVELRLESNAESVSGAVAAYIRYKVSVLDERRQYKELRAQINEVLQQKADGTFLWVALVCKELEGVINRNVLKVLGKMPSKLEELYSRMMSQIEELEYDEEDCKRVLSTVTLASQPLHLDELATLTGLPNDDLTDIINECGSFLTVCEEIVHLVHQSAQDYLKSDAGSKKIFPDGPGKGHVAIVLRSLGAMSATLERNIYRMLNPGRFIEQVDSVDPAPLARIRYACVYWIDHLCEIGSSLHHEIDLHDDGEIHTFLKNHFLHWLEALSLMRHMSSGVAMIRKLENLLGRCIDGSQLLNLVRDELRFILHNEMGD
jgi:hypothetical protein